jgi:RHS repeat-associated protein
VSYAYDLAGNTTSMTYPGEANPVTRCFDEAGRVVKIVDWDQSPSCAATTATTFSYDHDSNVTSVMYPNGVSDARTYDATGQMMSWETTKSSTTYASVTYGRTNAGMLASTNTTSAHLSPTGTETYGYDALDQLASTSGATNTTYQYNANDNPTRLAGMRQPFNDNQQICWQAPTGSGCSTWPSGATVFTHDAVGQRTKSIGPNDLDQTATRNYGYDQAGRLKSLTVDLPPTTATYEYSAGVRTAKTVNGTTTNFTYANNGDLPLLLQTVTGSTRTSWIYGPDGIAFIRRTNAGKSYLHHDQLGSIRLRTTNAGNHAANYSYTPFGALASQGGGDSELGYAGEYHDTETGFTYLRNRYYDPTTAQFTTRDPVESFTLEPYEYAHNNPTNYRDPTGLCGIFGDGPCTPAGIVDDIGERADDAWDRAYEETTDFVDDAWDAAYEHRVGIMQGGSVVLGVGAIIVTGGTASLLLAGGSALLAVGAEAADSKPCRGQRITQTAALAGVGLLGGVLWKGASQAANMASDGTNARFADNIGRAFGVGDLMTNLVPDPCGC